MGHHHQHLEQQGAAMPESFSRAMLTCPGLKFLQAPHELCPFWGHGTQHPARSHLTVWCPHADIVLDLHGPVGGPCRPPYGQNHPCRRLCLTCPAPACHRASDHHDAGWEVRPCFCCAYGGGCGRCPASWMGTRGVADPHSVRGHSCADLVQVWLLAEQPLRVGLHSQLGWGCSTLMSSAAQLACNHGQSSDVSRSCTGTASTGRPGLDKRGW